MKKVLILEDNPLALKHLKNLVEGTAIKAEVYAFDNVRDAYQCVMEKKMDLFLIDIILDTKKPGDASGLKFVENIRQIEYYSFTPVIFITSLEDARAYTYENLHCYSYIEKPFDADRVRHTVEKCLSFPGKTREAKTLYFRRDGIILAVESEEIVYAESLEHIMHIHTTKGDVLKIPYITLKKLIEEIDSMEFVQCSRNAIVNRKYVLNVDIPNRIITLKENRGRLDVGIMFKKNVKECFK